MQYWDLRGRIQHVTDRMRQERGEDWGQRGRRGRLAWDMKSWHKRGKVETQSGKTGTEQNKTGGGGKRGREVKGGHQMSRRGNQNTKVSRDVLGKEKKKRRHVIGVVGDWRKMKQIWIRTQKQWGKRGGGRRKSAERVTQCWQKTEADEGLWLKDIGYW